MEKLSIEVFRHGAYSSSPSYDRALASIFPYHIFLTHEESKEITGVLSSGYKYGPSHFGPTSFAVAYNYLEETRSGKTIILWMSGASLATLQQHSDIYEVSFHPEELPEE